MDGDKRTTLPLGPDGGRNFFAEQGRGPSGASKLGRHVQARQGGSSSLILKQQPCRMETPDAGTEGTGEDRGGSQMAGGCTEPCLLSCSAGPSEDCWAEGKGCKSGKVTLQSQGGWI